MAGKHKYIDKINEHIEKNKTLWFFSLFLLIIIFILSLAYLNIRTTVNITLPKVVLVNGGRVTIGEDSANQTFYKAWGRYVVYEIGNYNNNNIHSKIVELSSYLKPSLFKKYKKSFTDFEKNVVENSIKEKFTLEKDYVQGKTTNAIYKAEGVVEREISHIAKEKLFCTYRIGFEIINYHLFINQYRKKCEPIGKISKK